jgi:hypothetical protein
LRIDDLLKLKVANQHFFNWFAKKTTNTIKDKGFGVLTVHQNLNSFDRVI